MNKVEYIVPLYRLELVREKDIPYRSVKRSAAAVEIFHEMLDSSPVEKMACIHCNSSLNMIGAEIVAMGSVEKVSAMMADLFRGAIRNNASHVWIAHNHVDGNVRASMADYRYTITAANASILLDIALEDHFVIGPNAHYSIREHQAELEAEYQQMKRSDVLKFLQGMLPIKDGPPF